MSPPWRQARSTRPARSPARHSPGHLAPSGAFPHGRHKERRDTLLSSITAPATRASPREVRQDGPRHPAAGLPGAVPPPRSPPSLPPAGGLGRWVACAVVPVPTTRTPAKASPDWGGG